MPGVYEGQTVKPVLFFHPYMDFTDETLIAPLL